MAPPRIKLPSPHELSTVGWAILSIALSGLGWIAWPLVQRTHPATQFVLSSAATGMGLLIYAYGYAITRYLRESAAWAVSHDKVRNLHPVPTMIGTSFMSVSVTGFAWILHLISPHMIPGEHVVVAGIVAGIHTVCESGKAWILHWLLNRHNKGGQ